MKKEYGTPKAEKMEFNYSEVVVASGSIECNNSTKMTEGNTVEGERCTSTPASDTEYGDVFPG